jgi:hypothetical protein
MQQNCYKRKQTANIDYANNLMRQHMQGNRDKTRQWTVVFSMHQNQQKQVMQVKKTISWNQQMQTNRTIPNSKLDIIICDNEKGSTCQ